MKREQAEEFIQILERIVASELEQISLELEKIKTALHAIRVKLDKPTS